jgi:hypothetical protein
VSKALTVIVAIMMIALTGCTFHHTKDITEKLQPAELYELYEITPANLKARSKCPLPPAINIINVETREDDYVFWNLPTATHSINPKELTVGIVEYLKYGFEKSQIKVDSNSSKIIHVSFKDVKALIRLGTTGSNIKMNVNIPETKYSEIHEANGWSYGNLPKSMAYAAHGVTRKIIDDPVIQDYILCR